MPLNARAITNAISKSLNAPAVRTASITEHNGVIYQKGGHGWTTVYDPKRGSYKVRSSMVEKAFQTKETKYHTVEGSLYSDFIHNTTWGAKMSARKHVQGMLDKAVRDQDMETAAKLEKILASSDDKVAKFWDEWCEEQGNEGIEEYFSYDKEQSFEDYMRDEE